MKKISLIAGLIIIMTFSVSWTAIPQLMSYQGVLTDGAGGAVSDGNYNITFKIYNVSSGGAALWTETQSVSVSGGIFNVTLGSITSLSLAFDQAYWIGVSVNGGAELTPRRELTASPYSLNSQGVKGSSNSFPSAGNVGIGTTSPSSPLEVKFDNTSSNSPAISIDNAAGPAAQDVIGFKFAGVLNASIRKASGGDLFISSSSGVRFQSNNTNRMAILTSGYVGIGTDTPVELLDVAGGLKIGSTSNTNAGTIRWSGSDFEGYDGSTWESLTGGAGGTLPTGVSGQTLRHSGTSWVASSNLYNSGNYIGIGLTNPASKLHVNGGLSLGTSSGSIGWLEVYRTGIANPLILGSSSSLGGTMKFYDENYKLTITLAPDGNGTGGYFAVYRSAVDEGFVVEGNWGGSQEPRVSILGSARSTTFSMNASGDASVSLPADAISSSEMLDEPGAASATNGGSVTMDGTMQILLSRSITVPAAGYVLVLATCQPIASHNTGTTSHADFGVSDVSTSLPGNQDVAVFIDSNAATGQYDIPVSPHGLFSVASAGTYTYYLLGREYFGIFSAYDMQLTLVYIPTAYGTVTPTLASSVNVPDDEVQPDRSLTQADIEAERMESQAANQERIERELAEMRAEIEALKEEMARERQ